MPRPLHIVFAGGGTPGQLNPGLAVAAHLVERLPDAVVTFVGAGRGADRHVVRAAGFRYARLPSQPVPHSALHAVRFVTDNVAGYWAARWFFREKHVTGVVGLGGATSAPTVRAAMSRGIPTVLLEQNVVPGRVTRWLARSASAVCAGFEQTRTYFPSAVPLTVTGNPGRPAFEQLWRRNRDRAKGPTEKRLIVIGGSARSRSINEYMPRALCRLREHLAGWQVVHQSGDGQLQQTEQRYQQASVDALVVAYIDELAALVSKSDLVVCRAGGTALAELALAGVPAILVPSPAVMDYQWPNAEVCASVGAASIIDETEDSGSLDAALFADLKPLLSDPSRRAKMAANMRKMARPDAASRIADVVHDAICRTSIRLAA